jgi:hypothetical protein
MTKGYQRDVKFTNKDLRERVQIFDQKHHSPSVLSFPASTSLEMMAIEPTLQEYAESEVHKTCECRWYSNVLCKYNTYINYCALCERQ